MFARRARLPVVSPPLCPNCDDMPILPNPATGGYFNYCSRTCATQARQNRSNQQSGSLCEQCKLRPKFSNGTHAYRYCGRTCARLAANSTSNQTNLPTIPPVNPPANPPVNLPANPTVNPPANPPPANPPPANPPPANPPPANPLVNPPVNSSVNPSGLARPSPPQPTSSGQTCRTPRCKRPVFVHPDGTPSDYCMMTHKKWGEHGCISCRAAPRSNASVLCQSCHGNELKKAPAIVQVPEDHNNYKSVESQFKQSWRHKTACPEVKAIYKVISTEASLKQYDQYLDDVETRGNFATDGKSRGNEHRRWHGTTRKCKLGDTGNNTFCADAGCPLCCIIKSSFDLKFFKAATGWGRFGQGIYTSSTSSKSNDYSKNMGINSDWKALLLNKVVVGKGKKLTQNDTSLTAPPQGYDSVLAEVGGVLNYDELVVYNNDAVRPSYLIMYKSP
ncbi:ADP-ribosylation [Thelephora terrestris]|uniref:ADP-ribosylation n=1 Tax=Thelephora terrestris TaxID=56493 RepID=A0A9P6HNP2_9AGAM|nr:ADP-ribosylation [Thelephora terrestris]